MPADLPEILQTFRKNLQDEKLRHMVTNLAIKAEAEEKFSQFADSIIKPKPPAPIKRRKV
jgi:hypothetical protein